MVSRKDFNLFSLLTFSKTFSTCCFLSLRIFLFSANGILCIHTVYRKRVPVPTSLHTVSRFEKFCPFHDIIIYQLLFPKETSAIRLLLTRPAVKKKEQVFNFNLYSLFASAFLSFFFYFSLWQVIYRGFIFRARRVRYLFFVIL